MSSFQKTQRPGHHHFYTGEKNGQTEVYPDMTFTSVNGKSGYHVLKCGDQPNIVVAEDEYKITMDAEQTIPEAGQDIKLHGECTAIQKGLPDGTCMLEPLDKNPQYASNS